MSKYNYQIISDVFSHLKNKFCYATAGTLVRIIADHENVLIVEDQKGYRFSTQKTNLKQIK